MTDFLKRFFDDARLATTHQSIEVPRRRLFESEVYRAASWESLSSSLGDLQLEEVPAPETPVDAAYGRRNEILYLLRVERRPDVRRSLAARLALEERTLEDAFRMQVLEPAAKARRATEREADDLLQLD